MGPPRILIVTGPAGAGKTALVRVVGAEMGYQVSEWLNPARHVWSSEAGTLLPHVLLASRAAVHLYLVLSLCVATDAFVERPRVDMESTLRQFRDFLLRSERYGATITCVCIAHLMLVRSYLPIFKPSARRRLILLEDLPFLQKAKEALSAVFADHLKCASEFFRGIV